MAKQYLILGTGIAGFTAACEIRKQDSTAEITMVGAEPETTYLRPLLSKMDFRTFQRGKIQVVPEGWYRENRIQVLSGKTMVSIAPAAHSVTLEDGSVLPYEKCIYALGADCFVPPIPGWEKEGVLTLRTAQNFHALRRLCMTAKNAVLIGGGIIGMEMAWELHRMGIACTILEAAPRLMPNQLDAQSSRQLQAQVSGIGIPCYTGVQIASLTGEASVTGVALADGRWFPADIVILSTGIRAVTAPAIAAGLKCGRGVVTDDTLVTSDPDILAAGDCIQCSIPNPGLWNYARISGKIAGYNAAHPEAPRRFQLGSFPVILSIMGMGLFVVGSTAEGEGITTEVTQTPADSKERFFRVNPGSVNTPTYRKQFYREGKLCGAILMGDIREMAEIMPKLSGGSEYDWKE